MNISIYDFLKTICGDGDIEIRLIEEGSKIGNKTYSHSLMIHDNKIYSGYNKTLKYVGFDNTNIILSICLHEYNYYNFDDFYPFFVVNSPDFTKMKSCTSKDVDICKINAQFIDIDAPKDIRTDKVELNKWKKRKINKLLKYSLPPSIIVVSKNGLHCYWLIKDGKIDLFRYIQQQLIQQFKADESCINESHCLRLPNFEHKKDRKDKYPVLVYHFSDVRYTQEELSDILPKVEPETVKKCAKKQRENKPIAEIDNTHRKKLWDLVKMKINCVKDYGNKITCHCPLPDHEDHNPSSWIDKEYMWFHCGSSNCKTSLSLEELAEQMDWDDILEELKNSSYELDYKGKYKEIKDKTVNVNDVPELQLSKHEEKIKINLMDELVNIFNERNQNINEIHKQQIDDTLKILVKGSPSNTPDIIPLTMGAGKTTIIETYAVEILKHIKNNGVIIVRERIKDVISMTEEINKKAGKDISYPMYGLQVGECLIGRDSCNIKYSKTKKGYRKLTVCKEKKNCRYYNQKREQKKFPILIISQERVAFMNSIDKLNDFRTFIGEDNKKYSRKKILIDEKPILITAFKINNYQFESYKKSLAEKLHFSNVYDEFNNVMDLVKDVFAPCENKKRVKIDPINPDFNYSIDFVVEFEILTHMTNEFKIFPEVIKNIIKYGGHKEITKKKLDNDEFEYTVTVCTSYYNIYSYGDNFHSIVFDGTALCDLEYRHDEYRIFNFDELREYNNFTIYQCDFLKSSMTKMSDVNILNAFIKQVEEIINKYPNSKIYLPTYKKHKDYIENALRQHIDSNKVLTGHFGGTKGENKYRDCDIIILEGILHKSENVYINNYRAIMNENFEDLDCSIFGGIRRFNNKSIELFKIYDQLVNYLQEINRSKQRDKTKDVEGKLFVFTDDKIFLDILPLKFPGCKVEKWNPMVIIEDRVKNKTDSREKNEKIIYDYIKSNIDKDKISIKEIIDNTNLDKSTVSKNMKKPYIKSLLNEYNFKITKIWKEIIYIK